jgi:SWI/SNF-related matrix-associated actin-dependent regulator 1 of chromatin subfamily A
MQHKQLTAYKMAEYNFAEWIETSGMSPEALKAQAIVKMGVLKRLAGEAKLAAMANWVRDALEEEEKVAVYCIHRAVANSLFKELKEFHPVLATGEVSKKLRRASVVRFQEDKRVRLFIGSFAAAGTGVTLTKASHILCAELPWSGGVLSQGEDRLHRIGQTRPVWSWLAIAKGTIDEDLLCMLDLKNRIVAGALDGRKLEAKDTLWELMKRRRERG